MAAPPLVPQPRELALRPEGPPREARERASVDASLPAQGYALELDAAGIRIRHADDAGLRYARTTLHQLRVATDGERLPGLAIRDWPDFPVRGYMLDVSRDRVPTRETLAHVVSSLAALKLNHLQLYTEHTFAYPGHERVWRGASPLTADDVHWLDGLCRTRGIELAANQNCFGHMARWLAHEPYRALAEAPDGWQLRDGTRRPPSVLAPSDESYTLVAGLLRELTPHFTSRLVNVNCDETFELGQGRSKGAVRERGRGRVYLDFLLRIVRGLHEDGCHVLFWGDILRSHPELLSELPKDDATALVWHYEAPVDPAALPPALLERLADYGVDADTVRGFAGQVRPFAEAGYPHWVCPGTSTWNALVGRVPNARANLDDAARTGLESGAGGYLITDWGDNGHLQPPSVSLLPLAYGAAQAWCHEANGGLDPAPAVDAHLFRDGARELGAALTTLGGAYARTGRTTPNASPLFHALVGARPAAAFGELDRDGIARLLDDVAGARAAIGRSDPQAPDGPLARRELAQAAHLTELGARLLAAEAGLPDRAAPARELARAIAEQRACWLQRSRPGGLDDSTARLRRRHI